MGLGPGEKTASHNGSLALAERVPIYVHTYFIRCPAAEYAIQKPDGNLTRLLMSESLACETAVECRYVWT